MSDNIMNLTEKILIIKHANLADATILDSNYYTLISNTPNAEEKEQFLILRNNAQLRIKELTLAE